MLQMKKNEINTKASSVVSLNIIAVFIPHTEWHALRVINNDRLQVVRQQIQ